MIRQIPVHMRLDHLARLLVVDADEPVALLPRAHRVDEVQALDGFVLHALKTHLAVGNEQLFGHLLKVRHAEFIQRKQQPAGKQTHGQVRNTQAQQADTRRADRRDLMVTRMIRQRVKHRQQQRHRQHENQKPR